MCPSKLELLRQSHFLEHFRPLHGCDTAMCALAPSPLSICHSHNGQLGRTNIPPRTIGRKGRNLVGQEKIKIVSSLVDKYIGQNKRPVWLTFLACCTQINVDSPVHRSRGCCFRDRPLNVNRNAANDKCSLKARISFHLRIFMIYFS